MIANEGGVAFPRSRDELRRQLELGHSGEHADREPPDDEEDRVRDPERRRDRQHRRNRDDEGEGDESTDSVIESNGVKLLVDPISGAGSLAVRFDAWEVDVAVCGAQKGLMLPPGLAVLCVGPRALEVAERGGSPRYFLDWRPVIAQNRDGFFPYTPATGLLVGMREALRMLQEEGLPSVHARHERLAEGVMKLVGAVYELDSGRVRFLE